MDTSGAAPLIVVEGLAKRFGETDALGGVTFSISAGEIVGLLGPNGAGKTTTMKILLGMLKPSEGRAAVLGLDCTKHAREIKERIGYCPDEPAFYDFLTGRETLDFVASVRGLDRTAMWTRVDTLARRLDFVPQLDQLTHAYSHGMKKKLALLCALVHAPRVLLLDEPTNGLDPHIAHEVRDLLGELAREGTAVLLSTHLLDMADRMCERMLILHRGRVLAEGTPARVRELAGIEGSATLEDAFLRLCA